MRAISNEKLSETIERWEHDKPKLVIWTKQDEERLLVYKELLEYRRRTP